MVKGGKAKCKAVMLTVVGIALLFPLSASHSLHAQVTDGDYAARFIDLHRAHAKNPQDEATLYQLALFYFDNSNPMRSLPMAIDYARLAEQRHVDLLQRNRVRDLVQLQQRHNITINSIRDLKQAIADAAVQGVRLRTDLTLAEVDNYMAHFADYPDLVRLLRSRRYTIVFNDVLAHGNTDSCYAFMCSYPGTAEAAQVERRLVTMVGEELDDVGNIGAVDSLEARYPQSTLVRRAAARRRGQLAYLQADNEGSIAAYNRYLADYPASDESEQARRRVDDLLETELAKRHTASELASFADSNADLDIADRALARLRALIYSRRDAQAAQYYVDHFKLDPYRNEVYGRFYSWHVLEGNGAPLDRFALANPDFPFRHALEDDLERALEIDALPLLDDYTEKAYDRYASYVRLLMGRAIAVVPMQRMLQPLLLSHRYADALYRLEQFELCFDNQYRSQYDALRLLLTEVPPVRGLRAEFSLDSLDVRHPVVNPADGYLYYNDRHQLCRAVRRGNAWVPADTVRFSNTEATDLQLFGFFEGGRRMLLGSGGDIWVAEPEGNPSLGSSLWRISDIPPYPVNTDFVETDACMLPDGSGMLLASDRPGGYNLQPSRANFHGDTALATDLWFVPYTSHRWGTPINLGLTVNTPYCERHPVMSRNLKTLYFVSDGPTGLGYGDIYISERTDPADWTAWSTPRNLGREVNSGFREADLALGPDERHLWFTTNASGNWKAASLATSHDTASPGSSFSLNIGSLAPSLARLYVADIDRQTVTQVVDCDGTADAVDITMRRHGRFALLADAGTSFITAVEVDPDLMNVYRLPAYTCDELVAMDRPLPMPVVQFSVDGAELLPLAQLQLEQLARFLAAHPAVSAELLVDVPGPDARHAYDLSLRRCEALRDFLTQRGIAASRLLFSPYGNARVSIATGPAVGIRFRE